MLEKGRGSSHQFNWEDYNIPLPLPSKKGHGYVYENGFIRAYMISFLEMVFSPGSPIMPLLSSNKIHVVPVSLAKDGFALKPGFQVDRNAMAIVGGKEMYSLQYVKNNPTLPYENFKDKFVTEVQIMGITTLDNKCALIIGNDFTGSTGDGNSTLQCHLERLRELQHCLNCLKESSDAVVKNECDTTVCEECFSTESVCSRCRELNHVHWAPAFRRCDRCVERDLECSRAACLNLATDCQSMFKAALELLNNRQCEGTVDKLVAMCAPNPDIVHAGKNIHRSHCNWFLFFEDARFSIAVLRTVRIYSSLSKELASAVTDMALRGRDRMDTTYVAKCNSQPVADIIKRLEYIVHTMIPEMFWKEYGLNKPGVLVHPISVCTGSFGLLFVVDFTSGQLLKARLHNPVEVQILSSSVTNPTCVIYKKGVLFVAEENALLYMDVGNVVRLNPKAMRKQQLESEFQKRGLLEKNEKATVADMKSRLSRWVNENIPQTTREGGLQPLLDDVSPLALSSNEDRSVIFVSQRNSATILKVSVTCTGACLQGNVEPFITLPGKACCTGLAYSDETKDLYVADSQDEGGIYLIDAAGHDNKPSYVKVFVNSLKKRAYDLAIASSGEIFFTDVEARKIGKIINGHDVAYVVGSGNEEPRDGCQETASFVQPTGLCTDGKSLYVTDTGAGALKLITPPRPMARFLENVSVLYTSHGIHSPATSIEDCVASLNQTTGYFETAIEEAKESSGGRKTVEGPHGVPSSKTVKSVRMTVEALRNIKKNVLSVNSAYVSHIQPKSLVTLIVEHFNSKMREIYEVPTVLQYAYQFPDAVEETVKRVTNCGFSYFTSRGSYYEVPEDMVAFDEMPKLP